MASEQEKVAPPAEAPAVVVLPPEKPAPEPEKGALPPEAPPPEVTPTSYLVVVEVVLRVLLFAGTLTAVVIMVTSKQTELVKIPLLPFAAVPYTSRFTDSPAFIYFVAALSVAGLYSIITTLLSGLALLKPGSYKQLVSHFAVVDVLLLGIVAAAIGAAGGVGYIGLRGNSHSRWNKVCNIYDTFCIHLAVSIAAALFASIVLVLLILLSFFALSRKIPK